MSASTEKDNKLNIKEHTERETERERERERETEQRCVAYFSFCAAELFETEKNKKLKKRERNGR